MQHEKKVEALQKHIQAWHHAGNRAPFSFHYKKGHSNTTRSKSYKKGGKALDCHSLDQILQIDPDKKRVWVEPRVTMEKLLAATLPYGLIPPTVPEFKGITVGGALMGAAAESTSHHHGIFHDSCLGTELIAGDGRLIKTSREVNPDLHYGLSGSYGSLGLLASAELQLIPASPGVSLCYSIFSDPLDALESMMEKSENVPFLDGIIFSSDLAVIIEGAWIQHSVPKSSRSKWYGGHVKRLAQQRRTYQEEMPLVDYLFRYDQGAFWMGAFLFRFPFLTRYLGQGILNAWKPQHPYFSKNEIQLFQHLSFPPRILCQAAYPLMTSQRLWMFLHKAPRWVQERLIIQDCCIPTRNASMFLKEILQDPGTFPIWLCPIKGTETPQIFAPHWKEKTMMNFGIYGSPSYSAPMEEIIRKLEERTRRHEGRKVLYSRSFYTPKEFWDIYPKEPYEQLREKLSAQHVWHEITDKVLSQ